MLPPPCRFHANPGGTAKAGSMEMGLGMDPRTPLLKGLTVRTPFSEAMDPCGVNPAAVVRK